MENGGEMEVEVEVTRCFASRDAGSGCDGILKLASSEKTKRLQMWLLQWSEYLRDSFIHF